MRRIDVIGITFGVFLGGGLLYAVLKLAGIDGLSAGVWSQAFLVLGLLSWIGSYLFRVVRQDMTYNRQVQDYKDAVLQKQLEAMSPEELALLQAKIEHNK
jgi:UDP-N-acetylmuramyl pentapeptide phosphotransferase/UDP-N-acetylglucosamine-1-phosphate transferase